MTETVNSTDVAERACDFLMGVLDRMGITADIDVNEAEDKIAGKAWRKHFRQGAYLVYTAGGFYAYNGRCWRALDDAVLDRTVINVSDELYPALPGRSRVVAGVRAQLRARSAKTDFFSLRGEAAPLINCANGTLEVGADGSVTLRPHRPEDGQDRAALPPLELGGLGAVRAGPDRKSTRLNSSH